MIRYLVFSLLLASVANAQTAPSCADSNSVSGTLTSDLATTTETSLLAAPGSGNRYYISYVGVTNSDASVSTDVTISCGTAAAQKMTLHASATGGGWSGPIPSFIRCSQNTAVTITAGTTSAQLRAFVAACRMRN